VPNYSVEIKREDEFHVDHGDDRGRADVLYLVRFVLPVYE
jgi:hypothetical protein